MDGPMDGWTDGRADQQTDGQTNKAVVESRSTRLKML